MARLSALLGITLLAATAYGSTLLTLTITPNPPSPDGEVLVVSAVPYLEQRCTVAANRCVVQLSVAPDFAQFGAVTIRTANEKAASNMTAWVTVTTSRKDNKRRAVRH